MWGLLWSEVGGEEKGWNRRVAGLLENSWNAASRLTRGATNRSFVRRGEIFWGEEMGFFYDRWFFSKQTQRSWVVRLPSAVMKDSGLFSYPGTSGLLAVHPWIFHWEFVSPAECQHLRKGRLNSKHVDSSHRHLSIWPTSLQLRWKTKEVASRSCLNDVVQMCASVHCSPQKSCTILNWFGGFF